MYYLGRRVSMTVDEVIEMYKIATPRIFQTDSRVGLFKECCISSSFFDSRCQKIVKDYVRKKLPSLNNPALSGKNSQTG